MDRWHATARQQLHPARDEVAEFLGAPFRAAVRDADGNALGGVRLPHTTATYQGREVGAPLGSYNGFEFNADDPFTLGGGHFTPFDATRLAALYPTHGTYVRRVTMAAHRLVQRREILPEDARAYIKEASQSSIGK